MSAREFRPPVTAAPPAAQHARHHASRPALLGPRRARGLLAIGLVVFAAGCTNVSLPVIGTDTGNATPAPASSAPPTPDSRGVISYPNYQAVRAKAGETPTSIATRLGLDPAALALRNGLPEDAALRDGELLLLPERVAVEDGASAGDDLAAAASSALDRADGGSSAPAPSPTLPQGDEPVRHKVARGETAYSIARLYNVSVRSLADWNGLPADYAVREGQTLLVPLGKSGAPAIENDALVTEPGSGSATPQPPSATAPQPADVAPAAAATAAVTTTPLGGSQTKASDTAKLAKPVQGGILRGYKKGSNDGVDFSAPAGSPVSAAEGGTVAAITRDVDQVPIIVVRHPNNLLTVYANVDGIKVAKGDRVSRGQQIAVVRDSDPAFLHFEVREGFDSVDPVSFLQN